MKPLSFLEKGRGRPIVLLHPFPYSAELWRPQLEALADVGRVLAPSMRGFGGSPGWEGTPSIDRMADDVASSLDALEVGEPVILGGLSMGGYVALSFARRYGEKLRALILGDTRAESDSEEARADRDRAIARIESGDLAGFVRELVEKLVGRTTRATRPELVEQLWSLALQSPAGAVVDALRALRDRPDARPVLASIRVPTLILVGQEDVITPPAAACVLADRIAGAHLDVLPGAGHLTNVEVPDAFNIAVRHFLENLP